MFYFIIVNLGVCEVDLTASQDSCRKLRLKDIAAARLWYKITDSTSTIQFPLAQHVPWLDQTVASIQLYYALDEFEARYWMLFSTWLKIVEDTISPALLKGFAASTFVTNQEYVALHNAWNAAVTVSRKAK